MKTKIIILITGLILIIGIIVGYSVLSKKDNKEISLKSLNFSSGSGMFKDSIEKFNIECKNNKCNATIKPKNLSDKEEKKIEVDKKTKEKLERIITKYNIKEWDGYNKSDSRIMDGYSFNLNIQLEDSTKITAYGYMKYPKNYVEFRDEIEKIFNKLYEEN